MRLPWLAVGVPHWIWPHRAGADSSPVYIGPIREPASCSWPETLRRVDAGFSRARTSRRLIGARLRTTEATTVLLERNSYVQPAHSVVRGEALRRWRDWPRGVHRRAAAAPVGTDARSGHDPHPGTAWYPAVVALPGAGRRCRIDRPLVGLTLPGRAGRGHRPRITFLAGLSAPNLRVLRHDVVVKDFPLGSFDLIHARWLLVNLPEREEVLAKVVTWLAPGGWLVTEDVDFFPVDSSPHPALRRFIGAFEQLLADSHGADFRWARRRLPAALTEVGLVELGMSVSMKHVGDGSPDDAAYRMSMAQLRSGLVGRGLLSEAEYTAGIAPLDDPAVLDAPLANIAAWGRRPPS